MAMNPQAVWHLLKHTFDEWNEDKAPRLGAALAYYTIFSLAPLLVIAIAISGLVFGEEEARKQIAAEVSNTVGPTVGTAIEGLLQSAHDSGSGILATIMGVVTLLFGAVGAFNQLQDALNTIWKVTPKPGRGWMAIVKDRVLSFSIVLGIGFLLLVSLIVSTVLTALSKFLTPSALPGGTYLWQLINLAVSFGFITLLFAMIYKILPDVKLGWKDVWVGAAVTALLFTIGKYLLGLYLARASVASSYGAAGSLVLILVWVYYSSQILLFGAEFTRVYSIHYGKRILPSDNAVPLTGETLALQGMPSSTDVQTAAHCDGASRIS
jgi:membrane protein